MNNALPLPITEKTQAIRDIKAGQNELNNRFQDLTNEVSAIRKLMEAEKQSRETWKSAFMRAVAQFMSQVAVKKDKDGKRE